MMDKCLRDNAEVAGYQKELTEAGTQEKAGLGCAG
jgi:hypothetical protein